MKNKAILLKAISEKVEENPDCKLYKQMFNRMLMRIKRYKVDELDPVDVIEKVRTFYDLPGNYNTHKTRKREYAQARQQAMFIIKNNTRLSLSDVGSLFNRDHATVIHAKKTVQNLCDTDRGYNEQFNNLLKELKV